MKNVVYFLVLLLIVASCKNGSNKKAADRVITKENIKQDLIDIEKENPDIDSAKIDLVLSYIYTIDGRENYITQLIDGDESKRDLFSSYVVNADSFNRQVDNIFNNFKEDGYTYQMFFDEIDSTDSFRANYKKQELDELYAKVEEECQRRQKIAEFLSIATVSQKDSLLNSNTDLEFLAYGRDTILIEDLTTIDYKHETPDELSGFCPYLSNREPIAAEIRRINAERDKYIRENFNGFKKYNEDYSKLFIN